MSWPTVMARDWDSSVWCVLITDNTQFQPATTALNLWCNLCDRLFLVAWGCGVVAWVWLDSPPRKLHKRQRTVWHAYSCWSLLCCPWKSCQDFRTRWLTGHEAQIFSGCVCSEGSPSLFLESYSVWVTEFRGRLWLRLLSFPNCLGITWCIGFRISQVIRSCIPFTLCFGGCYWWGLGSHTHQSL